MSPNYSITRSGLRVYCQRLTNPVRWVCEDRLQTSARRYSLTRSAVIKGTDRSTPHPWSYVSEEQNSLRGNQKIFRRQDNILTTEISGYLSAVGFSDPPVNDLYNEALDKLNDKVRGNVDLSVDLAQTGQTLRMFKASDQILDFAKLAGLNRKIKTAAQIRAIGSKWLEYRYGWAPLVQTVYDCADQQTRTARNLMTKFRASATRGIPAYRTTLSLPLAGAMPTVNVNVQGKDAVTIGISLKVRDQDWNPDQWSSLNPVSIAWELIPYSFVVDWFYDVGGYLRALETAMLSRNDFVSGYVSTLRAFDATIEPYSGTWFDTSSRYEFRDCTAFRSKSQFSRTVLTSYPLPRRPVFKADLGSGRLLNAAGLLSQFLGRGR